MTDEEKQKLAEFMGGKAWYDKEGKQIWGHDDNGGLQLLLEIRGWGHIRNRFNTYKEAVKFQDLFGKFVEDSINEKISSSSEVKELKAEVEKLNKEKPVLHSPSEFPKISDDDEDFSVDVLIIDENGLNGVACYIYADKKWIFHTDTLVDYNEKGNETKWMWYYPLFDNTSLR